MIMNGWSTTSKELPHMLHHFLSIGDQLTTQDGLLFQGQRLVIPFALQTFFIDQLQWVIQAHKETMFWPSMYANIEDELSWCAHCNALKPHQIRSHYTCMKSQIFHGPSLPQTYSNDMAKCTLSLLILSLVGLSLTICLTLLHTWCSPHSHDWQCYTVCM